LLNGFSARAKFTVPRSRFKDWSLIGSAFRAEPLNPELLMKLNGTVLERRAIFRDNISGVEDFRNLNFQATNLKEIPNPKFQYPMPQTGLSF
jgi:hypothetical protein